MLADEMLAAVDHVLDVYASFVEGELSLAPSCIVRVNHTFCYTLYVLKLAPGVKLANDNCTE